EQTAILVGGGVGIPPMLYLAAVLENRAIAFAGATTRDLLPLTLTSDPSDPLVPQQIVAEFSRRGIASIVTTDDGTLGHKGFVTDALERWLADPIASRKSQIANPVLYTCGPEPMMKKVQQIAQEHRLPCQIAVERSMACGMGTCQSCCIRVAADRAADGWRYKLACTDGPVFAGEQLLW
ncbi:MAG: hypothetical protein ACREJC_11535, partial [Tepidisphaeraceae bacterium]